jgi:hypothetical protein
MSLARGFKKAAVSALASGDPLAANMADMFIERKSEFVAPVGVGQGAGEGGGGGARVLVLERFRGAAVHGGASLSDWHLWAVYFR